MMGNFKWCNNDSAEDLPYGVVLMISRNKDNIDIKDFKERKHSLFCKKDMNKIKEKFYDFVQHGKMDEMSRLYISLNARDEKKVQKELLHTLIDKDINFDYLEATVAGIAAKKENRKEDKWFFDFDSTRNDLLEAFIEDVREMSGLEPSFVATPHGYAVIVEHGFDIRELMFLWQSTATLKRDDLICYDWGRRIL